jgi:hypothetical protein
MKGTASTTRRKGKSCARCRARMPKFDTLEKATVNMRL